MHKGRSFLTIFSILLIGSLSLFTLLSIDRLYFFRQILFWLISFLICLPIVFRLNLSALRESGVFFWILTVFLLLLPLFWGAGIRGSYRWIFIRNLSVQPSEVAKPFFVISIASLVCLLEKKISDLSRILLATLLILIPSAIVFIQPDLGSSLVFVFAGFVILFFSGVRKSLVLGIWGGGFLLTMLSSNFLLAEYQKERLRAFLNPFEDPLGRGYNLIQAEIAIGSGGWIGRGVGAGTQTRLLFLPERHTDFIFSSFAEGFGFFGVFILLLAYFFLFWRLSQVVFSSEIKFIFLTKLGLLAYLWFQTIVNIGMNLGILPVTGVPLPFFSYGGSSLVAGLVSVALLLI